ncbi:condensation domain-containing protein [Rhodococcus sp. DK17]|uniref:condensation domain-containing protein n=1 Tax=Rhodococcus sp. DK17 TaxID=186196 RepID=UPI0002DCF5E3|nr:condensation domain-containing protein [Rhodococcus sp. DK17]
MSTGEVLPLTYDQLAVLRAGSRDASFGQYLELDGPLDEDRFCRALQKTLAECTGLHSTFVLDGPEPGQVTGAAVTGADVLDAAASDDPGRLVTTWIDHELNRPMDPGTGPLYVHVLFRLPHGRYGWFQRYHRLVNDELGMTAIVRRTAEAYETGAAAPTSPPESRPFVSPSVPLTADARYRESAAWADDRRYWEHLLAGASRHETPPGPIAGGENLGPFTVPADGALVRLARRSGGGPDAVLLAALAVYLHSRTAVDDVLVGHRSHGSTTPVRLSLAPQLTFDTLTRHVGLQLRRSRRHRYLASEDGAADSCPVAGGMRESLGVECIGAGAVAVVKRWDSGGDGMVVDVDDRDGSWTVDVHGPGDAQRLSHILAAAVGAPDTPLAGLDVLGSGERGVLVPVRGGVGVGVRLLRRFWRGCGVGWGWGGGVVWGCGVVVWGVG